MQNDSQSFKYSLPSESARLPSWRVRTALAEGARTVAEHPALIRHAALALLFYGGIAALASAPATGLIFAVFGEMAQLSAAHQFLAWVMTGVVFLPVSLVFFATPLAWGFARVSHHVLDVVRDRALGVTELARSRAEAERKAVAKTNANAEVPVYTPPLEDVMTVAVFPLLPIAIAAFGWQLLAVSGLQELAPAVVVAGWILLGLYAVVWRPIRTLFWAFVMPDEPTRIGQEISLRSCELTQTCRAKLFFLALTILLGIGATVGGWVAGAAGIMMSVPVTISSDPAELWPWWLLIIGGAAVLAVTLGVTGIAALAWAYLNQTQKAVPPAKRDDAPADAVDEWADEAWGFGTDPTTPPHTPPNRPAPRFSSEGSANEEF